MPVTRLSPTATPGRNYSFSAKTAAGAGVHTGEFTELSVTATPGRRHSFSAKTAAGAGVHTGEFTELSVTATPGRRHAFAAKTAAPAVPAAGGRAPDEGLKEFYFRDEQDIMEIIELYMLCLN